jgi:prevent-host-death family protein
MVAGTPSLPFTELVHERRGEPALTDVASRGYIRSVKTVGLRELKNRLSEYVRLVRKGEGVAVTDRGDVVAELLPPRPAVADPTGRRGLATLVDRGSLTLGAGNDPHAYPRLPKRLARRKRERLLDEERGDR